MDKWLFVCGIPQKYKLLYILNIKSSGSKLSGNNLQLQDLCWICPFCDKTTFWCGMRPIRCRKKIWNWKIYRICQVLYVTKQPFVYEMKPNCKWSPRLQSSKICIMHTCWVLGGSLQLAWWPASAAVDWLLELQTKVHTKAPTRTSSCLKVAATTKTE